MKEKFEELLPCIGIEGIEKLEIKGIVKKTINYKTSEDKSSMINFFIPSADLKSQSSISRVPDGTKMI